MAGKGDRAFNFLDRNMDQKQKDFDEGLSAFNARKSGTQNAGRSPDFYRGWTWGWGRDDARSGNQCFFPNDPDYSAGYSSVAVGTEELAGHKKDPTRIQSSVFTTTIILGGRP